MTRTTLFWLAGGLAIVGALCLLLGISLMGNNVRSHLSDTYQQYSSDTDGSRYECDGSPRQVAEDIVAYAEPEARASDRGTEYLRYDDDIVSVGPDGNRDCTIRVEDVQGSNYMGGAFIFLGPGFFPGAPSGGAGGSPGGPGGSK